MGTHMKTTIDIADSLLHRTKSIARSEHVTLRELVEEGLSLALDRRIRTRRVPGIKAVTFKGKGLSPEFQSGGWAALRDAAYEGRGA